MSEFGNANYDRKSKFKKKTFFKINDGDNVYRILPPFGDLAEAGVWSRFYKIHFGYSNLEGKLRTFISPQVKNNRTKMIEVPDAALDRLDMLKTALEKAKAESNGPLTAQLNALVGREGIYNVDSKHYMNAMDLNGAVGILKVGHKVKLDLDEEIRKLRAEGVDPLSLDSGRYFNFTRTKGSTDRDTLTKVSVYRQKIEVAGVGKVEQEVVSTLSKEALSRCKSDASNLDGLFSVVTAEECEQIVKESDLKTGKSPACDRIFDQRWKAEREAKTFAAAGTKTQPHPVQEPQGSDEPDESYAPPAAVAIAVKPMTASSAPLTVAPKATPVVPAKTTPTTAPAPTQAQYIAEQSDADFFASIGVEV